MIKSFLAAVMVASLIGCGGSSTVVRPSDQHDQNLRRAISTSLHKQECMDKAQQCVLEVCNTWQEACDAEPAYCHLPTWLNACITSCARKEKVCEAK